MPKKPKTQRSQTIFQKPSEEQLSRVVPKVVCAECGKKMLRLTHTHLENIHNGMTIEEYIAKHGQDATKPQIKGKDLVLGNVPARKNGKLTEQTKAEILDLARKGYPRSTITSMVGLSYQTFNNWMKWGDPSNVDKHGNRLYPDAYYDFHRDFNRAEAMAEIAAVDILRDAGGVDWRAAVEYLQRRFPENWRLESKKIVDVEGEVTHRHVSDIDVDKLLEDPEVAEMACSLLERLSEGDREVIDVDAIEVEPEESE